MCSPCDGLFSHVLVCRKALSSPIFSTNGGGSTYECCLMLLNSDTEEPPLLLNTAASWHARAHLCVCVREEELFPEFKTFNLTFLIGRPQMKLCCLILPHLLASVCNFKGYGETAGGCSLSEAFTSETQASRTSSLS